MFRQIREWSQGLIYLDFLYQLAWISVAVPLGTALLVVFLVVGQSEGAFVMAAIVLHGLIVLAVGLWIARDADRYSRKLRKEVKLRKPQPNGDMSEVAGIAPQPPWMGMG
jgi:hypothetical protein